MSIVDNIVAKCESLKKAADNLRALAGIATHPWYAALDPGYANLKEMARIQADIVLAQAQALRDAIPD